MSKHRLDYLDELEAEAIYILREVAGQFEKPALLFSGGKDSITLVHLALKAFRPAAKDLGRHGGVGRDKGDGREGDVFLHCSILLQPSIVRQTRRGKGGDGATLVGGDGREIREHRGRMPQNG